MNSRQLQTLLHYVENMRDETMTILGADKPEDIDAWPCAYSLFTGKSCNGKHCKKCEVEE